MKITSLASKAVIVASLAFAGLGVASAPAFAKHAPGYVKMMHVTTDDGTTHDYEVVKMHGHMMVLVPEDEVLEALHQKVFRKTQ
jgi:hypothetical protein